MPRKPGGGPGHSDFADSRVRISQELMEGFNLRFLQPLPFRLTWIAPRYNL